MTSPIVSVIIPITKRYKYAEQCLESVLNSDYRDLEIIVVTDDIRYAKSLAADSRIKFVKCTVPYIGDARNAGLKIAKGKYISFLDADDIICDEFFSILCRELENHPEVDIVECPLEVFESVYHPVLYGHVMAHTFAVTHEEKFAHLESSPEEGICQMNKLYRADIFKNLQYPSHLLCEGDSLIYKELKVARKIMYLNAPLYGYRYERSALAMSENREQYFIDSIKARGNVIDQAYADGAANLLNKADSNDWIEFMTSRMINELIELYPQVQHTFEVKEALKAAKAKYGRYRRCITNHFRYDMFFVFPLFVAKTRMGKNKSNY